MVFGIETADRTDEACKKSPAASGKLRLDGEHLIREGHSPACGLHLRRVAKLVSVADQV